MWWQNNTFEYHMHKVIVIYIHKNIEYVIQSWHTYHSYLQMIETNMSTQIYKIDDQYSDISFIINGILYGLHKNVVTKCLFFKVLFENEIYMGIKNDEIVISNMNGEPIKNTNVFRILNWLYDTNINKNKQFAFSTDDLSVKNIANIIEYYTLSDFFQIDSIKKKCADTLKNIIDKKYNDFKKINRKGFIEKKCISHMDSRNKKCTKCAKDNYILYEYGNMQFMISDNDENIDILAVNNLLTIFNEQFMRLKNIIPKYFNKCIEEIDDREDFVMIVSSGNKICDIKKHVLEAIHVYCNILGFRYYGGILQSIDPIIKNNVKCCDFVDYIYNVYRFMFTDDIYKSLCWMQCREKCIPLDIFENLMHIIGNKNKLISLLDTYTWPKDTDINKAYVMHLKKICTEHSELDLFSEKMKAYSNINRYAA